MDTCAVCGTELNAPSKKIGSRAFCDRHFARALGTRRSAYTGTAAGIVVNCTFAVILGLFLGNHILPDNPGGRALGLCLAAIPSLIWLVVFYRLDSIEPEPVTSVLGVFVLGVLLEGAVLVPLCVLIVPAVPFATAGRPVIDFLQNILFTGVARAALIFIGLRVVVYSNSEFDEKTDGIVYGAAIGLGTAAAANMASALGHDGLWLGSAGYDFVVNTLSGACSGAFIGYGLAKAKFEGIGAGLVLPFLMIAAIIEGATRYLAETYAVIGLSHGSAIKLVFAVALCLVAFTSLFILARLENRNALSSVEKEVTK